LKKTAKKIQNQKGQGVMEYIILTGLIGIICLGAVKKFGKSLDTRLNQIDRKIKNELVIK
jgi:Flp pilus assembly pilin Flp